MITSKLIDLTGRKFGSLTVLNISEAHPNTRYKYWVCKCDCGKQYEVNGCNLRKGLVKSCGCSSHRWDENKFINGIKRNLYSAYKSGAKRRNLEFCLSNKEFELLIGLPCFYCNSDLSNKITRKWGKRDSQKTIYFAYNGIDRINNSIGYTLENCVPCCFTCNSAKGTLPLEDFLTWLFNIKGNFDTMVENIFNVEEGRNILEEFKIKYFSGPDSEKY